MAESTINPTSKWENITTSLSIDKGTVYGYVDKINKIAIVSFNSQTGNTDGTITLSDITSDANASGSLRYGGYLQISRNSNTISISNTTAYAVGQVIFPIK